MKQPERRGFGSKLIERGTIQCGERVVCVSTAAGLKFTEFKVKYHEGSVPGVTGMVPIRELTRRDFTYGTKRFVGRLIGSTPGYLPRSKSCCGG